MDEKVNNLSQRERSIAERYAAGETYKEIAGALFIAPATVRNHLAAIYRKLGVSGKPGLISALAGATSNAARATPSEIGLADQSPIRYCASSDGASIAHAQVGSGYPLILAGSWMTHLEWDWDNPGWGHHLRELARDFTLIRYDQRGNGMSDWDVEISFDKMVGDLQNVIDCYEYGKVAIFGPSQAAAVSIAYAENIPSGFHT